MFQTPERTLFYNTFNTKQIRIHTDRIGTHKLRIYPLHPNEEYHFG